MNELVAELTHSLDAENPWPGLMPFTEATQAFFHGREAEAAELLRRVRRERLTILFGQSGLGKTSLLCAGLFPRLRAADFLPVYLRLDWTTAHISPLSQIKQALADNLAEHGVEGRAPGSDETLWAYFHDKETEFWNRRNRLITPVAVFDQFEEIFTLGHGVASAWAVLDELAAIIENRPPANVHSALEDESPRGSPLRFRQGELQGDTGSARGFPARSRRPAAAVVDHGKSHASDAHERPAGARCHPRLRQSAHRAGCSREGNCVRRREPPPRGRRTSRRARAGGA